MEHPKIKHREAKQPTGHNLQNCKHFFCFLRAVLQQSIHYMRVDYPLFEITRWAKSPQLALRGTVHVGVIIQWHKKPHSTKTPLQEKPQTTAEGLFKSGLPHGLSFYPQTGAFSALIGGAVFVYAPEELPLWPSTRWWPQWRQLLAEAQL